MKEVKPVVLRLGRGYLSKGGVRKVYLFPGKGAREGYGVARGLVFGMSRTDVLRTYEVSKKALLKAANKPGGLHSVHLTITSKWDSGSIPFTHQTQHVKGKSFRVGCWQFKKGNYRKLMRWLKEEKNARPESGKKKVSMYPSTSSGKQRKVRATNTEGKTKRVSLCGA